MTDCCNEFGQCTQGSNCPIRACTRRMPAPPINSTKVPTYHRRTCDQLGVCQGRGDCDCVASVPPEAGTFRITYLGKDDGAWEAVTLADLWRWLRPTLPALAGVLLAVGLLSLGTGWLTEHHSALLWHLLQGVS